MAGRPWTEKELSELKRLIGEGLPYKAIAKKLGRTYAAVHTKATANDLYNPTKKPWSDEEERAASVLSYQEFKAIYPDRTYHAYTNKRRTFEVQNLQLVDYSRQVERVDGDAVIVACVHVPQTDARMWNRALAVGQRDRIPTLIIAGDIVTGDMFSHWDVKEDWDFDKELESLHAHLVGALDAFEEVVITPGNHVNNRIVRISNGHIRLAHLIEMAGLPDDLRARVKTTDIDFLDLRSGNERFYVGHASNYSRIDGRVSVTYAEKYERHVITGNGHRLGHQVSKSGRWHGWDIGTMADPRYMGYANMSLTSFPVMLQSFVTVRDGVVRSYGSGPPVTNWSDELGLDPGIEAA